MYIAIRVSGSAVKNLTCNAGDVAGAVKVDSWTGKMPWRKKWQPAPVFCLGNPVDSPWGHRRVGHNLKTQQQHTYWFYLLLRTSFTLCGEFQKIFWPWGSTSNHCLIKKAFGTSFNCRITEEQFSQSPKCQAIFRLIASVLLIALTFPK